MHVCGVEGAMVWLVCGAKVWVGTDLQMSVWMRLTAVIFRTVYTSDVLSGLSSKTS